MKRRSYLRCRWWRNDFSKAFTLVEMLVAEAVFLMLLVLALQLIFGVTQVTQTQKKQMDSFTDARQALDRMSLDWDARVRRSDLNATFTKQSGNDEFGFLSQVAAYSGTRRLAVVSYRVNPTTYTLERGVLGYNWQATDPAPDNNPLFKFPITSIPVLAATQYELLSGTVFRMEFCFLRKVDASGASLSSYTTDSTLNLGSEDFAGVVIGIATIDEESRKKISQTQLAAMVQALPDITTDGSDPLSVWTPIVESQNFAKTANIPQSVAASVRIFQRIIYVNE